MNAKGPDRISLSTALQGTPVTIFLQDSEGRFRWFENEQSVWANGNLVGMRADNVLDPASAIAFRQAKRTARQSGQQVTVELQALHTVALQGQPRFLKVTVRAVRDRDGTGHAFLCSAIDITEEKQREQTLRALMLEVAHRSKNMLAMVLSLASQTARTSSSVKGFSRALTGRVQSLAKSQNVITDSEWAGATFHQLVRVQVTDIVPEGAQPVEVDGDDLMFSPNAAIHIGLALHELVAQAWTKGTLIDSDGSISIHCFVDRDPTGAPVARLVWAEAFGESSRKHQEAADGFSRAVLERVVPGAVNGNARVKVEANTVRYDLTVDASEFRRLPKAAAEARSGT